MAIVMVKVQKGIEIKDIQKKDLPKYIAMGWKEVNTKETINVNPMPFPKI